LKSKAFNKSLQPRVFYLLGLKMRYQRLYYLIKKSTFHYRVKPVERKIDSVVAYAVLREIVSTYAFASIA
jgi:hypothetical protein